MRHDKALHELLKGRSHRFPRVRMSAIDNFIAELAAGKYSDNPQNLIAKVNDAVTAMSILNDPRRYSGIVPSLRQGTNRTAVLTTKSGGSTTSGWRCWEVVYNPTNQILVGIPNWYVPSGGVETGMGAAMTVALSLEYPFKSGQFYPFTFGGAATGVAPDKTTIETDVLNLPFTIPPFSKFRINGWFSLAAGGTVPSLNFTNNCDRGNGDEYQVGVGNNTLTDTYLGATTTFVGSVQPLYVLTGNNNSPVWGVVGDSIAGGTNDENFDPSGGRGMFGRAVAGYAPQLNFGVGGDLAQNYATAGASTLRQAAMLRAGMTDYFLQLGTNDLYSGRTSAQLIANRLTIKGFYPGIHCAETTILPRSTSSDGFQVMALQTITADGTNNASRITFNDQCRGTPPTGVPIQSDVIDVAYGLEFSNGVHGTLNQYAPVIDGSCWKPGNTIDGTHPNSQGYLLLCQYIQNYLSVHS